MTESRRIVKVFLASPSDLADERRAAKAIVDDFNASWADELGYQVELVGWEDTISEAGRPQAIINRDLEGCEIFVGMMWKRWGTPPDRGGKYTSGFEEEFRTSLARHKQTGQPVVSLLFKEIDAEFLRDPGRDLKKVLAFRDDLISKKELLFEQFRDLREFEGKFRRCVTSHVLRLKSQETEQSAGANQSTATEEPPPQPVVRDGKDETPLSMKGIDFLRQLISKAQSPDTNTPAGAVDIARFRLLSTVLWQQGNDEQSLGVHDANLLYIEAKGLDLGYPEMEALLKCGLEHFSHENVPVWRWSTLVDGYYPDMLPYLSVTAFANQRAGALDAMRLVGNSMEFEPIIGRSRIVGLWLNAADSVKTSALRYLEDYGRPADLEFIRKEFAKNDSQTSARAAAAILRISLRESCAKAIQALYELQPASIDDGLVDQIFAKAESIDTETLVKGLDQPNGDVRLRVVALLRSRDALPSASAEKLLNDVDASVRYEAFKFLEERGREFSDEAVRAILVKPTSSGFGFLYSGSDRLGEEKLEQVRWERLCKLSDDELEALVQRDLVFNRRAEFVLADRHFQARAADLRRHIGDTYKQDFDRALAKLVSALPKDEDETIQRVKSLSESIRKEMTRKALDVICRRGGIGDLPTVRVALSDANLEYSSCDIEFLGRLGEWEDVPLIVQRISSAGRLGTSLLGGDTEERYRESAEAVLALSKNRLKDLLAIEMPTALLTHVLAQSTDREFRNLPDTALMDLLHSESDSVRKVVALRAVRILGKRRLTDLLTGYPKHGDKKYFYNVIHWLDLGVSLSRDRAEPAASKALREMEASGRMGGARPHRRRRRLGRGQVQLVQ